MEALATIESTIRSTFADVMTVPIGSAGDTVPIPLRHLADFSGFFRQMLEMREDAPTGAEQWGAAMQQNARKSAWIFAVSFTLVLSPEQKDARAKYLGRDGEAEALLELARFTQLRDDVVNRMWAELLPDNVVVFHGRRGGSSRALVGLSRSFRTPSVPTFAFWATKKDSSVTDSGFSIDDDVFLCLSRNPTVAGGLGCVLLKYRFTPAAALALASATRTAYQRLLRCVLDYKDPRDKLRNDIVRRIADISPLCVPPALGLTSSIGSSDLFHVGGGLFLEDHQVSLPGNVLAAMGQEIGRERGVRNEIDFVLWSANASSDSALRNSANGACPYVRSSRRPQESVVGVSIIPSGLQMRVVYDMVA